MFWKKNLQWWTGVVLVCLMGSLVLFAFVARRPLCIDSKIVDKIDSVSGEHSASAFRCGLHRHVDYDEILANRTRDLGRRLQKLERLFDWMGALKSRINIKIFSGTGFEFHVEGHQIEISEGLLQSQGQLEKGILKIWFRERAHLSLRKDPLIEESLTDFLYSIYSGSLDLQEPLTGIFLNEDIEAKWPRVLTTTKGNCRGIWNPIEQLQICEGLNEFSKGKGTADELDILSLRPLISQSLLAAYFKMKPAEQLALVKKISENLDSWNFLDQQSGMSSLNQKKQIYTEATFELESWIHSLQTISPKFSTFFASVLRSRGFDGIDSGADLDTLIFTDMLGGKRDPRLDLVLNTEFQKGSSKHLLGWISGSKIQMGLDQEKLDLELFGEIKANKGLFFYCGQIDTKTLLNAARKVEKLIYVDSCALETAQLGGFFDKGTREFALQNPKTKFIEFHTSSLLSALHHLPEINPVIALGPGSQQTQFFKLLGWTTPTFDKGVSAYRAQSVIEAIDWYRL